MVRQRVNLFDPSAGVIDTTISDVGEGGTVTLPDGETEEVTVTRYGGRGRVARRLYAGKTVAEWEAETGKVPPGSAYRPGIQYFTDREWAEIQKGPIVSPTGEIRKPPVFTSGSKQGDVYVDSSGNVIQYQGGGEQHRVGIIGQDVQAGTEVKSLGGRLLGFIRPAPVAPVDIPGVPTEQPPATITQRVKQQFVSMVKGWIPTTQIESERMMTFPERYAERKGITPQSIREKKRALAASSQLGLSSAERTRLREEIQFAEKTVLPQIAFQKRYGPGGTAWAAEKAEKERTGIWPGEFEKQVKESQESILSTPGGRTLEDFFGKTAEAAEKVREFKPPPGFTQFGGAIPFTIAGAAVGTVAEFLKPTSLVATYKGAEAVGKTVLKKPGVVAGAVPIAAGTLAVGAGSFALAHPVRAVGEAVGLTILGGYRPAAYTPALIPKLTYGKAYGVRGVFLERKGVARGIVKVGEFEPGKLPQPITPIETSVMLSHVQKAAKLSPEMAKQATRVTEGVRVGRLLEYQKSAYWRDFKLNAEHLTPKANVVVERIVRAEPNVVVAGSTAQMLSLKPSEVIRAARDVDLYVPAKAKAALVQKITKAIKASGQEVRVKGSLVEVKHEGIWRHGVDIHDLEAVPEVTGIGSEAQEGIAYGFKPKPPTKASGVPAVRLGEQLTRKLEGALLPRSKAEVLTTEKADIAFYHGTSPKNIPKILDKGLKVSEAHLDQVIYLTQNLHEAKLFTLPELAPKGTKPGSVLKVVFTEAELKAKGWSPAEITRAKQGKILESTMFDDIPASRISIVSDLTKKGAEIVFEPKHAGRVKDIGDIPTVARTLIESGRTQGIGAIPILGAAKRLKLLKAEKALAEFKSTFPEGTFDKPVKELLFEQEKPSAAGIAAEPYKAGRPYAPGIDSYKPAGYTSAKYPAAKYYDLGKAYAPGGYISAGYKYARGRGYADLYKTPSYTPTYGRQAYKPLVAQAAYTPGGTPDYKTPGTPGYRPPVYQPPGYKPPYSPTYAAAYTSTYTPGYRPPTYRPPYKPTTTAPPYYPPYYPPTRKPKPTPYYPPGKRPKGKKEEKSKKKLAYNVLVRREGKWLVLKTGLPKGLALRAGELYSTRTLGASFKVRQQGVTTLKDIVYRPSKELFRGFKIVRGARVPLKDMYIQRRGKRLVTGSEIKAIQQARGAVKAVGAKLNPFGRAIKKIRKKVKRKRKK